MRCTWTSALPPERDYPTDKTVIFKGYFAEGKPLSGTESTEE